MMADPPRNAGAALPWRPGGIGAGSSGAMTAVFHRLGCARFGVPLLVVVALGALLLAIRYWPRAPLSASFPTSRAVYDLNGRLLRLTLSADEKYRLWTPLASVSGDFIEAVLLHEDRHFYLHPGVNPAALLRAGLRTYTGGARQGGSTITMQLARLVYRLNTRSPWGKVEQIARAAEFELLYSKAQILEAYLNLAPYGQNIEGVGAAALIYFNRAPQRLGLSEALTLAVIPQSPYRRSLGDEKRTLVDARSRLYRQWVARHPEASEQRGLVQLPMNLRGTSDLPFRAPHLTAMLLADRPFGAAGNVITSTLDLNLQQSLERQLENYVAHERRVGIVNASAMLLDTRDMGVRALVGSANFFDEEIDGQVNGTQARRSPGSTLKPFIYGLALDQGLLHPLTMLKDAPTAFGPFTPENFDGRFAGPITARDALIKSRNVPAVALSARLAQPTLYQFLKSAGIARMQSERHYGLGLALGGGEVTMEELVRMYAMLANRGALRPVRYVSAPPSARSARGATTGDGGRGSNVVRGAHDPAAEEVRLLSEEASFIILDLLRDNPRPDLAYSAKGRLPVAWKTGTSWGFRDAWSVGVFGPYVLAVWVGNFDGQGNPAFIGVQAAAPLFFQMVDAIVALQPGIVEPSFRQPPNLRRIEVCAASGDLPNAACPLRAHTWFIPGKSPIKISTLHRSVAIDVRTGRAACPPVDPRYVRHEVYEFWPSDLAHLFAQAGLPRRQPPASPCAADDASGARPAITSPLRAMTYTQRAGAAPQSIVLAAAADADARELHWFANEAYVGVTSPGVPFAWQPEPGAYTLRVVDDHGRSDARVVRVELIQ
jgi:penicillin-binding protein 1C